MVPYVLSALARRWWPLSLALRLVIGNECGQGGMNPKTIEYHNFGKQESGPSTIELQNLQIQFLNSVGKFK